MDEHPPTTRKPRVAVVFGGRSEEHAVSCATAGSVLNAIDPERYDVVPVGITHEGRWVLESSDPERLAITSADKLPEVDASRATVALASAERSSELVVHEPASVPRTLGEVDVVFPLLHGPWGEDGTIQGLLEMAGVRYVGAGVLASAVGMDKHYMKIVFQAQGLPVLPYAVITRRDWVRYPGFGAIISIVLAGGAIAADLLTHKTTLWVHATSLGSVESTFERRRRWKSEPATIPDGLVRMSVGIEDVDDLWDDLAAALDDLTA